MSRVVKRSFQYLVLCFIVMHILFVSYLFLRQINTVKANDNQTTQQQVLSATTVKFKELSGKPSPNEIFERVNAIRVESGLEPLTPNTKLAEVAEARAKDMSNRGYYAHKSPDGLYYYDYLKDGFSSGSSYSCENLDLGFTLSADTYVSDWLNSDKGHRKCMLENRVTDAGYAVATIDKLSGGQPAYVIVAIHAQAIK